MAFGRMMRVLDALLASAVALVGGMVPVVLAVLLRAVATRRRPRRSTSSRQFAASWLQAMPLRVLVTRQQPLQSNPPRKPGTPLFKTVPQRVLTTRQSPLQSASSRQSGTPWLKTVPLRVLATAQHLWQSTLLRQSVAWSLKAMAPRQSAMWPRMAVWRQRQATSPPRSSPGVPRRRIVYLGTGQIAQVFPRNGANLFLERECSDFGGYFEHMWNIHFPAGTRGGLDLSPRHHLLDVDFGLADRAHRFRLTATVWREVRFLIWLLPFLVRSRASIVTATNPYLQGVNAAIGSRLLGLPYAVIITRDYDWDWAVLGKQAFGSVYPSRRLERAIGRWVLRHADLVLADRRYYRDFAVRNGARPDRAVATRVLADSAFAEAKASPEIRERYGLGAGPLLTYVGRLDADKFPVDLIECLALVARWFPEAQLACAGSGRSVAEMQRRATELGVADRLYLLGALDLTELASLLASSDAVVAPHMGYTLIEAGLTGVPIVTYDYDFHGEVIADGETGFLAPLHDVVALAQRVRCILEDPGRAQAMGARLREQLLREHSLEAVVPLYRQAYDLVLGLVP